MILQPKLILANPDLLREASQAFKLVRLLPQFRELPLYRTAAGRLKLAAGGGPLAELAQYPTVGKADLRTHFPANFGCSEEALDELVERGLAELEFTSGTSDDRVPVMFPRGWWDAQEREALLLNRFVGSLLDKNPEARRATLTPPACNGRTCPTVWQSRSQRIFGQSLFVNLARIPFVLSEEEQARMAAEIMDWAPLFLDLDPVHGVWFALYCERKGIRLPSLKFILCSYEFLSVVHRRILQRVFRVPVFNLYGSTETGHLLMENERGEMTASPNIAYLEILQPDPNGIGEMVATSISNDLMPLVRYRMGDLVCRREAPYAAVYTVHGRVRDALRNAAGHRVTSWEVDQCFAETRGIVHYQLRQKSDGELSLRYLPDQADSAAGRPTEAVARLQQLLGDSRPMAVESVDLLPPTPSGKFRLTATE